LQPDLIVAPMWDEDLYWGIADEEVDQIREIAPIVGIRVDNRTIDEPIGRVAELAVALGADVAAVAEARDRFDVASDELRTALVAKPGLRVVAASGSASEVYVAYPPGFSELAYYQSLGMHLVEPEDCPTSNGFWETLREEADRYPVDVILADARTGDIDQLGQVPDRVLGLPAVTADQIASWYTAQALGFDNSAEIISDQAAAASADLV
jgi:iron complex transport system substrate-binding protein